MKNPILKKKFQDEQESATDQDNFQSNINQGGKNPPLRFQKPSFSRNIPIEIKSESILMKVFWSFMVFMMFIFIIRLGHFYFALGVLLISVVLFWELMQLKRRADADLVVSHQMGLNWYFFFIAVGYSYGRVLSPKLTSFYVNNQFILYYIKHQELIYFMLWVVGIFIFLKGLKKGFYKYQISQFGWAHIGMLLVVVQGSVVIINLYQGMIWVIFPSLLVIINDICSYLFGFFFGKNLLMGKFDSKKTWEGFLGGLFSLLVCSFFLAGYLQQINWIICPKNDIQLNPMLSEVQCEIPEVFKLQHNFEINLDWFPQSWMAHSIISDTDKNYVFANYLYQQSQIKYSVFQLHAFIISLFASVISPFAGNFARGLKRALRRNSQDNEIQIGMFERMDCQILIGMFTYLYLHQVIITSTMAISSLTYQISLLQLNEQISLMKKVQEIVQNRLLSQNITLEEYYLQIENSQLYDFNIN